MPPRVPDAAATFRNLFWSDQHFKCLGWGKDGKYTGVKWFFHTCAKVLLVVPKVLGLIPMIPLLIVPESFMEKPIFSGKLKREDVLADFSTALGTLATAFSGYWLCSWLFGSAAPKIDQVEGTEPVSEGIVSGALGTARDVVAANPVKIAGAVLACAAGAGMCLASRTGSAKSESTESSDKKARSGRRTRKAKGPKTATDSENSYLFPKFIIAVLAVLGVLILYCICSQSDHRDEEIIVPDIENGLFRQARQP